MTTETDFVKVPRVYVADLAAYNDGVLRGVWLTLDDTDPDTYSAAITGMLERSPVPGAEEWEVHDREYCPRIAGADLWAAYAEVLERFDGIPADRVAWAFDAVDAAHLDADEWADVLEERVTFYASESTGDAATLADYAWENGLVDMSCSHEHRAGVDYTRARCSAALLLEQYQSAVLLAWANDMIHGGAVNMHYFDGGEWGIVWSE